MCTAVSNEEKKAAVEESLKGNPFGVGKKSEGDPSGRESFRRALDEKYKTEVREPQVMTGSQLGSLYEERMPVSLRDMAQRNKPLAMDKPSPLSDLPKSENVEDRRDEPKMESDAQLTDVWADMGDYYDRSKSDRPWSEGGNRKLATQLGLGSINVPETPEGGWDHVYAPYGEDGETTAMGSKTGVDPIRPQYNTIGAARAARNPPDWPRGEEVSPTGTNDLPGMVDGGGEGKGAD